MRRLLFFLSLHSCTAGSLFPSAAVFSPGLSNITCFRIPSVVQTLDGTLVAFAEARRGSCGDGDSHEIASRRSKDGGITWDALSIAAGNETYWVGNPEAVVRADGSLLMLVALHRQGCTGNCVSGNAVLTSHDSGLSWSSCRDITADMGPAAKARTGPGTALLLKGEGRNGGRIVAPVSTGTYTADFVLLSDDSGSTWRLAANASNASSPATWLGRDEAQAAALPNGSTLLLMRHQAEPWEGKAAAVSHDGGATWGDAVTPWGRKDVCPTCPSALPSPNCQASITSFGGVVYYSGANSTNHNRVRLVVRRSQDSAATWDDGLLIDAGSSGYSCLVGAPLLNATNCSAAGCGGVLYEGGGGLLSFVRFPLL
jgi:sialidase-1